MKPPSPLTRLTEKWLELPPNLRGFIWLSAGTLIVALTDAAIKLLGRTIPPVELVFFRYVVGIIVLRPGAGVIDPYALIAVGAAISMAMANALIRFMAPTEPPTRILFYYHFGGVILLAGPAFWVWQTPVGMDWLLIFLLGGGQTLAMICYVRAFSIGEANAIGPSEYARLIYAGLIGIFLFGETIDVWTIVGVLIITASTLYIAREESRKPGP